MWVQRKEDCSQQVWPRHMCGMDGTDDGTSPGIGVDLCHPHQLLGSRDRSRGAGLGQTPESPAGCDGFWMSISSPCGRCSPAGVQRHPEPSGAGLVSVWGPLTWGSLGVSLRGWRAHARGGWDAGWFCLWFLGTPYSLGPKIVGTWVAFRVTVDPGGGLMIDWGP